MSQIGIGSEVVLIHDHASPSLGGTLDPRLSLQGGFQSVQNKIPINTIYYNPFNGAYSATGSTVCPVNTLYLIPVQLENGGNILGVAAFNSGVTGSNIRLGLYKSDPLTFAPTTLCFEGLSNAVGTNTVTGANQIDAGVYYLALQTNNAATFRVRDVTAPNFFSLGTTTPWTQHYNHLMATRAYAPLSNPCDIGLGAAMYMAQIPWLIGRAI